MDLLRFCQQRRDLQRYYRSERGSVARVIIGTSESCRILRRFEIIIGSHFQSQCEIRRLLPWPEPKD